MKQKFLHTHTQTRGDYLFNPGLGEPFLTETELLETIRKKRHIWLYVQQLRCEKKDLNKDSIKFMDLEKKYNTDEGWIYVTKKILQINNNVTDKQAQDVNR